MTHEQITVSLVGVSTLRLRSHLTHVRDLGPKTAEEVERILASLPLLA